jgi:hypothetical protein
VIFDGELVDGQVEFTHVSGDAVENLRVRYIQNGSVEFEDWSGLVEQGNSFTTDGMPDDATQVWLTWRPETPDAAVLFRLQ